MLIFISKIRFLQNRRGGGEIKLILFCLTLMIFNPFQKSTAWTNACVCTVWNVFYKCIFVGTIALFLPYVNLFDLSWNFDRVVSLPLSACCCQWLILIRVHIENYLVYIGTVQGLFINMYSSPRKKYKLCDVIFCLFQNGHVRRKCS